MSHFARVNAQGIVEQVIVAEQDFIDALPDKTSWVQTSYNTHGGKHPEGRPLRKNYAGIGYIYDPQRDAFYTPRPYPSWILNEETCLWEPPVPMPSDAVDPITAKLYPDTGLKVYVWDEPQQNWIEVNNGINN